MTQLYTTPEYMPKGFKSEYRRDICKPMFIAGFFTIAKIKNQSVVV